MDVGIETVDHAGGHQFGLLLTRVIGGADKQLGLPQPGQATYCHRAGSVRLEYDIRGFGLRPVGDLRALGSRPSELCAHVRSPMAG
jgi:hypothetical protein